MQVNNIGYGQWLHSRGSLGGLQGSRMAISVSGDGKSGTLTHFTTPTSSHCTGYAHKFSIQHEKDRDPISMSHLVIHHRLTTKEIHNTSMIHFMDCSNHVNYNLKGQGTLCAIHYTDSDTYLLGFITSFDKTIKVSLCSDSTCFFKVPDQPMLS